ncbi:MAG TPA: MBL fold metallo-hydrolase [Solirubrobacterales bacterium]|nr:MBL fold metallo-hydrolase [Solirubrobacterales bacterium]
MAATLTWVGHATVEVEIDGVRLLTDPILRPRVGPLRREAPPPRPMTDAPDAVLISHLHRDHADLPSLRRLGTRARLIAPKETRRFFTRRGFTAVEELAPGEAAAVGGVTVRAVPALHDSGRGPLRPAAAVGFLIEGADRRIYFAGDTDRFDEMADLASPDVALLPIWGWGPSLGPGHMDPARAAEAAALIRPRVLVPIHWGTLYPRFLRHVHPDPLFTPPRQLERALQAAGSDAELRLLLPGMSTTV